MNRRRIAYGETGRQWAVALCWLLLILVASPARAQIERVTGDWQQFVLDNDIWRPLGIYRVEKTGEQYKMVPVEQTKGPGVTNSKGLFDVQFSAEDWAFKSDWGNNDIGQFRLRRAAPSVYLGWSYLREEKRNFNMWVLVR
jgi:hypothetical protein